MTTTPDPIDFDAAYTLSAIPDLAAEWDLAANGIGPHQVDVFSADPATWHCQTVAEHPTWVMTPREAVALPDTTLRCPTCRGDGMNPRSLSLARPDLAVSLHPESGDPVTLGVSSVREVLWLCGEDPSHQPYAMTPRARSLSSTNPCPSCYGPTMRWSEDRLVASVRAWTPRART